jgi:glycosyltransferase involved in cell wall biosynthesis
LTDSTDIASKTGTPRRVLMVAACPFPCARGTPARILSQASALARTGLDVHIVTYPLGDADPPSGFTVHRIPRVPSRRSFQAGPSLQKLLVLDPLLALMTLRVARRVRPELVHGHHVEGGTVAALAARVLGVPSVFDAHTSLEQELPIYVGRPLAFALGPLGRRLDLGVVRRCTSTITTTERLRAYLLREGRDWLSGDRVTTIGTPLDVLAFLDGAATPRRGSGKTPPRIVYAGSLAPFQGVDLLLRAFAEVRDVVPEAELVLVSNGARGGNRAAPPNAPGVQLVQAPDLSVEFAVLASADVAVSPRSIAGGLPQKVLNYMRVALPTVACASSGDVLEHGRTGWITQDGDARAMAQALVYLLRRPALRRELGDNARRDVKLRFDGERIAEAILRVYRDAFERHAGGSVR